jgi:NAD-specific glutamate dehydrogenase
MQKAMQKMAQSGQSGSGGSGGEGQEGQSGSGDESDDGSSPGGSSPGGPSAMQQFINQINKLAQQQMALNNQMQAMAQGQGGGQSSEKELMRQQAQMSKLAAQQEAVKKSLEQMAEEQRQSKTGIHQAIDDLRKIADEMQQTVGDMKSSGVRPETIQRQERILSRLLQAERSVHERDKDEERESKPGENVVRESPRALDIQSPAAQKALQEEVLHSRETGYTADYNALIRKYFEGLQKK